MPIKPQQQMLNEKLTGIGGWLIWFQIRLWLTLLQIIFLKIDGVFLLITLTALCLAFFYRRDIRFRIFYCILIGANFGLATLTYFKSGGIYTGTAVSYCAFEGIIIHALFHSRRVQNTFMKRKL